MTAPFDYLIEIMAKTVNTPVLVVGDAMVDIYTQGTSTRRMPEDENAPIFLVQESTATLGGAANVAANLAALTIPTTFLCLTGDDEARRSLITLSEESGIAAENFLIDASRPTTSKNRLSINGEYFGRIDREQTHDVSGKAREELLARYDYALGTIKAVILSDYCKGCLPAGLIPNLIEKAAAQNIPVFVDSKKKDCAVFKGAFLIKPNKIELQERTGEKEAQKAGRALIKQSGISHILASRSEEGVYLVNEEQCTHYPATARKVAEVSGAGDTMIAVCAAACAAGADISDAAWLANLAAGVTVEKDTTSTITRDDLLAAIGRHHSERKLA